MGYKNIFNEVYLNNKSLDWYEKNTTLITKDTWKPLRQDDVVLCLYGMGSYEMGSAIDNDLFSKVWNDVGQVSIEIYSNIRKNPQTDLYTFDISDVGVNNNRELVVEAPFGEDNLNIYALVLKKIDALYLIRPPMNKFINYTQLPNTK